MRFIEDVKDISAAFIEGWRSGLRETRAQCIHDDKEMRGQINEAQLDNMLADTFPASDSVTMY